MKKKGILLIAALMSTAVSFSQLVENGETVAKTNEAAKVAGEKLSPLQFVFAGGWFMIPIVLLLIYTIYLVVERYRYISRTTKYNLGLLQDVKTYLDKGDMDGALMQAKNDSSSHGVVVAEGIQTIGRPTAEVESNMERAVDIEVAKMERHMGHLGLIAGIAPTFGFIGTIAGVIKIFYNISISSDVSIGNISGGLYEKMISSGSGLIVGIVAYSSYHLLNSMIDKYALHAQTVNLKFINILNRPAKWQ
jgi:biopolymer transport protein ExbB